MSDTETELVQNSWRKRYEKALTNLDKVERSVYGKRKQFIEDADKALVEGINNSDPNAPKNLDQIGARIKDDLINVYGWTEGQTTLIWDYLPDDHYVKRTQESSRNPTSLETLNLEEVPDWLQSFFNEYLDKENLQTLGPAEREELGKKMKKDLGLIKNKIPSLAKFLDNVFASFEIFLEPEKTGKTMPSKEFWGPSEIYGRILEREEMLSRMLKDVKDIRQQLFKFKPNSKVDQSLVSKFAEAEKNVFEPIDKLIFATNDAYMTLTDPNVDDKWGETLSKWMEIGKAKYLEYGNHGSGEIHSVLTGKYVMRLGKHNVLDDAGNVRKTVDAVVTVPIKREFTREQVADKVLFKPVGAIDCPACKERFKFPDEYMDLIAGDLFERAWKSLLVNPLTQFLDSMTNDIVLVKEFKSPQQFYREQCALYRKKVTEEEIANVVNIEVKPEKIKLETLQKMEFNMKYGNADRRHNMAEHFSDQS